MSMVIDKFANKEYLNASSTCECECEWTGLSHLCSVRVLTCSCTVVAEADGYECSSLPVIASILESCLSIGYWYLCCCHQAVTTLTMTDRCWRPDNVNRPPCSIWILNCLFWPFSQGSKFRISGPRTLTQVQDPHSTTPLQISLDFLIL